MSSMANKVFDSGVTRSAQADIIAYPVITDIGVTNEGLDTAINDNTRNTRKRLYRYPARLTEAQLGIGVPYNPKNAVISE